MSEPPNALHLVERAAQRLLEADDPTASQLLRRAAPLKQPGSDPVVGPQEADPGQLAPIPPGTGDAAASALLRQPSSATPSNAPTAAESAPLPTPSAAGTSHVAAPLKQPSGDVALPPHEANPSVRKPDLRKPDLRKPDQRKPDQRKPDRRKSDLRQSDTLKPDLNGPDLNGPDLNTMGGIEAAALKSAGMIDWSLNRGRLSEEFRIVQGQVLQALASAAVKPPALANLIMLTSAKPGEGKTFSSLNLAGSLASCSPQTVILVDVDTKRHTLTTRLRLQTRPGLLNLAFNPHMEFADALIGTSLPNLRVLPIGHNELQESLSGGKPIIHVLERLGRAYADCLIVLDTPPCLSSSDPSTLAPFVGAVVMLIEAQQTQRAEVEAALDLVEACPTAMLMLNKVQLTGSDTFGAYGY